MNKVIKTMNLPDGSNNAMEVLKTYISESRINEDSVASLSNHLTARGLDTPLYLFGRNADSKAVLNFLPNVSGVIDDYEESETEWCGVPIVKARDLTSDALIINCVTNSKPLTAQNRLTRAGFENVYYLADLQAALPDYLPFPDFVLKTRESVSEKWEDWAELYESLDDEISQKTLIDILKYRLAGNPRDMNGYTFRPNEQYFESFMLRAGDVFVDGGSFDGETSRIYSRVCPNYAAIHVIEPDQQNLSVCRRNLNGLERLFFHEIGLSNRRGFLRFEGGHGSSSGVSNNGVDNIEVDRIEVLVPEASFLKLDLEGWELNALEGAENLILENAPNLAIGAYHHPDDFLTIFRFLKRLRPQYRVRLRHYTESWTETVMYFSENFRD